MSFFGKVQCPTFDVLRLMMMIIIDTQNIPVFSLTLIFFEDIIVRRGGENSH